MLDTKKLEQDSIVDDNTLAKVLKLAHEQMELEQKIAGIQQTLVMLMEQHRKIAEDLLPEAMNEFDEITLKGGATILIDKGVTANIKEENKKVAHAWLRKHKHGSLIKREFKIAFGMGEEKKAREFIRTVKPLKVKAEQKEYVHSSTLKAFVKRELEQNHELPDAIDVFEFKKAKIKMP